MKRGIALILAGILAGCQAPHEFAEERAGRWSIETGQLRFTSGERVLVGEVVVSRRGAGDFQIEFSKGPGLPLLKVRADSTHARAEGVLARGSWQGPLARAPKGLRGWIELRDAFAKPQASRFSVTSAESGDRFDFVFQR